MREREREVGEVGVMVIDDPPPKKKPNMPGSNSE